MDDPSSNSEREKLFSYWYELPVTAIIPQKKFKLIDEHPIRQGMIQVLRKGIDDDGRIRHAMSLKELRPEVEELINSNRSDDIQVKLTALYHHRDKMLDEELIKEVATFLEGKRYVTYYGRTARAFLAETFPTDKADEKKSLLTNVIFAKNTDEDINKEKVKALVNELTEEWLSSQENLVKWVEDNVEMINQAEFDVIELYELLFGIVVFNDRTEKIVKQIKDYLDL